MSLQSRTFLVRAQEKSQKRGFGRTVVQAYAAAFQSICPISGKKEYWYEQLKVSILEEHPKDGQWEVKNEIDVTTLFDSYDEIGEAVYAKLCSVRSLVFADHDGTDEFQIISNSVVSESDLSKTHKIHLYGEDADASELIAHYRVYEFKENLNGGTYGCTQLIGLSIDGTPIQKSGITESDQERLLSWCEQNGMIWHEGETDHVRMMHKAFSEDPIDQPKIKPGIRKAA